MNLASADISLAKVSKDWGDTQAVSGLSFVARAGEFTVLLGPSGCGKSTTLRLIAGLEQVSRGQIMMGGRDITRQPPAKRQLSMVFQSYALFPHLTVAENIVFGLRVRRVARGEREARLQRVAELLGLDMLLKRRPSQLSGGQQQRVALGRAIIAEKPVCLMDEPLSNLDAKLRHEMRLEIRALQRKLGITMIYVTHDQAEAMSMADRVILLRDGHIEQNGPPEEIYNRPATSFVGRFIGTPPMNILDIGNNPDQFLVGEFGVQLKSSGGASGKSLGVRCEDVQMGADSGLPATIRGVEYLGADSIIDCDIGDQRIAVRTQGRVTLTPGEATQLTWSSDAIHWFDRDTGKRIGGSN
jgi:sn-glycerol 3-phosphate transport system ATP-binding protein